VSTVGGELTLRDVSTAGEEAESVSASDFGFSKAGYRIEFTNRNKT
jgi:hypothetical protein